MYRKSTLIKFSLEIARNEGRNTGVSDNKREYNSVSGLSNKKRESIKGVQKAVKKAKRLRLKNERPIHTRTVFQSGKVLKLDQFDRVMY